MAPLEANPTTVILITGINGYIASHIGHQLLSAGYTVRGTSRSAAAKDRLIAGPFSPYESHYEHVLVPDITLPGAFDTAVKGVHAIVHTASPVDFTLTTLSAYLTPAINGVLSILHSAHTHAGPQLRSFVLTSSIAAIADRWTHPFGTPYAYTETDWNTNSLPEALKSFSPPVAYGASKTLAERALWRFFDPSFPFPSTQIPTSTTLSFPPNPSTPPTFTPTAINPGVVIGPPILLPTSPAHLNTTLLPIWQLFTNTTSPPGSIPPQIGGATWIDVRDVAALHAWAATHPDEAAGRRFLATSGKAPPQAVADLLRREFPERKGVMPEGKPGEGYVQGYGWEGEEVGGQSADAGRMRSVFEEVGWKGRGFEESVLETVAVLRGHFGEG